MEYVKISEVETVVEIKDTDNILMNSENLPVQINITNFKEKILKNIDSAKVLYNNKDFPELLNSKQALDYALVQPLFVHAWGDCNSLMRSSSDADTQEDYAYAEYNADCEYGIAGSITLNWEYNYSTEKMNTQYIGYTIIENVNGVDVKTEVSHQLIDNSIRTYTINVAENFKYINIGISAEFINFFASYISSNIKFICPFRISNLNLAYNEAGEITTPVNTELLNLIIHDNDSDFGRIDDYSVSFDTLIGIDKYLCFIYPTNMAQYKLPDLYINNFLVTPELLGSAEIYYYKGNKQYNLYKVGRNNLGKVNVFVDPVNII